MKAQAASFRTLRENMELERLQLNRLAEQMIHDKRKLNSPEVLRQYEVFNKYYNRFTKALKVQGCRI